MAFRKRPGSKYKSQFTSWYAQKHFNGKEEDSKGTESKEEDNTTPLSQSLDTTQLLPMGPDGLPEGLDPKLREAVVKREKAFKVATEINLNSEIHDLSMKAFRIKSEDYPANLIEQVDTIAKYLYELYHYDTSLDLRNILKKIKIALHYIENYRKQNPVSEKIINFIDHAKRILPHLLRYNSAATTTATEVAAPTTTVATEAVASSSSSSTTTILNQFRALQWQQFLCYYNYFVFKNYVDLARQLTATEFRNMAATISSSTPLEQQTFLNMYDYYTNLFKPSTSSHYVARMPLPSAQVAVEDERLRLS